MLIHSILFFFVLLTVARFLRVTKLQHIHSLPPRQPISAAYATPGECNCEPIKGFDAAKRRMYV